MIPGAFTYHRPASVAEAVGLRSLVGRQRQVCCRRAQPYSDDETTHGGA